MQPGIENEIQIAAALDSDYCENATKFEERVRTAIERTSVGVVINFAGFSTCK